MGRGGTGRADAAHRVRESGRQWRLSDEERDWGKAGTNEGWLSAWYCIYCWWSGQGFLKSRHPGFLSGAMASVYGEEGAERRLYSERMVDSAKHQERAVPGPGSAEQGGWAWNRICNDPGTRTNREGGAWGEEQHQLRLARQPEVPGPDWGLLFPYQPRGCNSSSCKLPWQVHSPTLKS